jgi:hypothetical protein
MTYILAVQKCAGLRPTIYLMSRKKKKTYKLRKIIFVLTYCRFLAVVYPVGSITLRYVQYVR